MSTIQPTTFQLKNGRTIILRSPDPTNAAQLVAYVREIFTEGEFVLTTLEDFRLTEEQEATWLQLNLDDPDNVVIVAESDKQIIGMINFHSGKRKRIAHLGELSMSVDKDWRSLGVGRALLSTLIFWSQQHPTIEKLYLEVFANNARAIALYRSLGFQEEGRFAKQIKLGPDEYIDTINMARFVK